MNRFRRLFIYDTSVVVVIGLISVAGCSDRSGSGVGPTSGATQTAQQREISQRLFESAVDALNRLDDYDESQINSAVEQVVRRLNESLESGLLDNKHGEPFSVEDGKNLRETVWLREAADFAVAGAADPLVRAERLFDWTIRNIQLVSDDAPASAAVVDERLPYLPWHMLILGRGSALDRAWLFVLLARQQGLDVVLLAPRGAKPEVGKSATLAALVHDGNLYLFDTRWSTPIPGPGGKGIATLAQVQQDDKLLRALDLDAVDGPKYPLTTEEAKQLTAYVDTSSMYLAPKYERLESLLKGDAKLVLSINADEITERVKKCTAEVDVQRWPMRDERFAASREKSAYDSLVMLLLPFRSSPAEEGERRFRSPLWAARVKHVTGNYYDELTGRANLNRLYQFARPASDELKQLEIDRAKWAYAYRIKMYATYWLGTISYDMENYETAVQYFKLILGDEANAGWTAGARYNLGRTYEALDNRADAAKTYQTAYFGVKPDAACLYRALRIENSAK